MGSLFLLCSVIIVSSVVQCNFSCDTNDKDNSVKNYIASGFQYDISRELQTTEVESDTIQLFYNCIQNKGKSNEVAVISFVIRGADNSNQLADTTDTSTFEGRVNLKCNNGYWIVTKSSQKPLLSVPTVCQRGCDSSLTDPCLGCQIECAYGMEPKVDCSGCEFKTMTPSPISSSKDTTSWSNYTTNVVGTTHITFTPANATEAPPIGVNSGVTTKPKPGKTNPRTQLVTTSSSNKVVTQTTNTTVPMLSSPPEVNGTTPDGDSSDNSTSTSLTTLGVTVINTSDGEVGNTTFTTETASLPTTRTTPDVPPGDDDEKDVSDSKSGDDDHSDNKNNQGNDDEKNSNNEPNYPEDDDEDNNDVDTGESTDSWCKEAGFCKNNGRAICHQNKFMFCICNEPFTGDYCETKNNLAVLNQDSSTNFWDWKIAKYIIWGLAAFGLIAFLVVVFMSVRCIRGARRRRRKPQHEARGPYTYDSLGMRPVLPVAVPPHLQLSSSPDHHGPPVPAPTPPSDSSLTHGSSDLPADEAGFDPDRRSNEFHLNSEGEEEYDMESATTSTEQIQIHRPFYHVPCKDPTTTDDGLHHHPDVERSLSRGTNSSRVHTSRDTSRDYINTSLPRHHQTTKLDGSYAHLDKNVKFVRSNAGHEYLNLPQCP